MRLHQNYPNPFNPVTNIEYDLPVDGNIELKIYDITGRLIKTLVNEFKTAGSYIVSFNASDLSSGVYFYSMNFDGKQIGRETYDSCKVKIPLPQRPRKIAGRCCGDEEKFVVLK
ncbi:MAG: T9SS type A sorting domain-containing protein [Ignavibacteria bacterium]|nr:T9SS type A sorting domain-containing protein [Ignavibacteria bacterium]